MSRARLSLHYVQNVYVVFSTHSYGVEGQALSPLVQIIGVNQDPSYFRDVLPDMLTWCVFFREFPDRSPPIIVATPVYPRIEEPPVASHTTPPRLILVTSPEFDSIEEHKVTGTAFSGPYPRS